jgi:hypothetical protein
MNPTLSMWLNIAVSVASALTGAAALFSDLFGEGTAKKIVACVSLGSLIISAINTGLHATSTAQAGPLAPQPLMPGR